MKSYQQFEVSQTRPDDLLSEFIAGVVIATVKWIAFFTVTFIILQLICKDNPPINP